MAAVTQSDYDYFKWALEQPTEKKTPWYKSYPSALAKGLGGSLSQAANEMQKVGDLIQGFTGVPNPSQAGQAAQTIDQTLQDLPSNDGEVEGVLQRTGKLAPMVAMGGSGVLGTLLRSVLGGVGGETAKQLGLGDLGQSLAEIPGMIGPDLARAIPTAGRQAQLANFGRQQGLSEADLALTLGQRGVVKDLATDISSKGGKTVRAFDQTRQALGRVWDTLRSTPEAQQSLTGQQSSRLINGLSNRLSRMPAEARNRIQTDFNDLLGSQMTGDDIINFWQDLNYYINDGERVLGTLKQDLQGALTEISPQLGEDFRITNELYANFSDLAGRMGPNIAEHLIKAGEQGLAISAVTTGNFPLLKKLIGPVGARIAAREMVINPRLQNMSARFINGIERGLPAVSRQAYDQLIVELGKKSAEAAMAISDFDVEEFFNTLPKERKQQQSK